MPSAAPSNADGERTRLASIDVLRGFTILGMLLVNNIALGKDSPEQLQHADWNQGIHFADMVFPWFLLISGLSVPLAAASHVKRGQSAHDWIVKVLTRTGLLVMLGCMVDSAIKGRMAFSLGVLQLIGLSYCVAALVAHLSQPKRLGLALALFATHTLVLLYAPWGDGMSGVIGPKQNFIYWLNSTYLKPFHLEGLFSVVSTSALVIIGTVMGDALRREEGIETQEIMYLGGTGLVLALCGMGLGSVLLYSKALWTSSYLLVTGGTGLMFLGALRLVVDKSRITQPFYPFLVFGANALTVYILPILFKMLILEKIRYIVHEKLVNFMTPVDAPTLPEVQSVLQSLFGKRKQPEKVSTADLDIRLL